MRWSAETLAWARRVAEELGVRPGAVLRRAAEMGAQHLDVAAALRAEVNGNGGGALAGAAVGEVTAFGVGYAERVAREAQERASAAGVGTLAGRAPVPAPPDGTVGPTGAAAAPRPAAAPGAHPEMKLVLAVVRQISSVWPAAPTDVTRARRKVELGHVTVAGVVVREPDTIVDPATVAVAR